MKAARQGFILAQSRLGYSYAQGLGVEIDLQQVFRWWSIAAEGGNAVARKNLDILCHDNPRVCEAGVVVA